MIRGIIYDTLILRLTARWYAAVLDRNPDGAHLLDVGIGTGGALLKNAGLVRQKNLQITGIDIDPDYVERARSRLKNSPLSEHVQAKLESVYDHQGGPYDAVYFSGSFMLLPEPEQALRHCRELLQPEGRIFFTLTVHRDNSRWMEKLKPRLKRLTSIDFGRVTYEQQLKAQIHAAGLELEEFTQLKQHGSRADCLAVARLAPADQSQCGHPRCTGSDHSASQTVQEPAELTG